MHLQDETAPEALCHQTIPHPDHGQLDDVRRGALNRHVQRHAFPEGPGIEIRALQLGQIPPAVPQGAYTALRACLLHHVVHIAFHTRKAVQISLHIGLRLCRAHPDVLRQ